MTMASYVAHPKGRDRLESDKAPTAPNDDQERGKYVPENSEQRPDFPSTTKDTGSYIPTITIRDDLLPALEECYNTTKRPCARGDTAGKVIGDELRGEPTYPTRENGNRETSSLLALHVSPCVDTGSSQETTQYDRATCTSTDDPELEVFSHEDDKDDRPTLPTSNSEEPPTSDDNGGSNKEEIIKNIHGQYLFDMKDNIGQPIPTIRDGTNIDPEDIKCDVCKAYPEPDQHVIDALRNFEKAVNPLARSSSPPKSGLEAQLDLSGSACSINVGFMNVITRWVQDSTVTFNTDEKSFPSDLLANHATKCAKEAADEWNKGGIGVQFEQVANNQPTTFRITYAKQPHNRPTLAAHAFLPKPNVNRSQHLYVTPMGFCKWNGNYDNLTGILCHEFGHILGLRHWFAKEKEKNESCVQFGGNDFRSVMNYHIDPRKYCIQQSDYDETRSFYAYQGIYYNWFPIVDVYPARF